MFFLSPFCFFLFFLLLVRSFYCFFWFFPRSHPIAPLPPDPTASTEKTKKKSPRRRLCRVPDPYTSTATESTLTVMLMVYCFWILAMSVRAWWWGRAGKTADKFRSSRRVQFLVLSSLVTMLLLLPAIIVEYLQPRVKGEWRQAGRRNRTEKLRDFFFACMARLTRNLGAQPYKLSRTRRRHHRNRSPGRWGHPRGFPAFIDTHVKKVNTRN